MRERTLWTAVLGLAMQDLRKLGSSDPQERDKGERARVWLLSPVHDSDLRTVCLWAEIDADRVRRAARAYLEGPRRVLYLHAGREMRRNGERIDAAM